MKTLFQYNWQVRDDWFKWCEDVPEDELLKKRTGGVGGILHTLFHIIDVEYSWIRLLLGKSEFEEAFEACSSLEHIRKLSVQFHEEVKPFVTSWSSEMERKELTLPSPDGGWKTFLHGEIMRHAIVHEIHHIGQLSVWSRELGEKPVTANLISRGLFE